MKLSFRTLDGIAIVSVAGIVDSRSAGQLYDALVACIDNGSAKLIVDLSGVHVMTHAGTRSLVAAAKLMKTVGGDLRLCGARRSIEDFLRSLGFNHLLKCDPTQSAAIARLGAAPFEFPVATVVPAPRAARYHSRAALYHGSAA